MDALYERNKRWGLVGKSYIFSEKNEQFCLEDLIDETIRKVVSVHTAENLQLVKPTELNVDNIMDKAIEIGFGSKIQLHNDGGGSIDLEEMFSKIRYFVKGLGCSIILVDPLHTAIKNLSNENIEEVMDRFIKLCKETKCAVILSTHTRKPCLLYTSPSPRDQRGSLMPASG